MICNNYTGLDFCEGEIGYFTDGYYGEFKNAVDWFTNNQLVQLEVVTEYAFKE